MDLKQKLLSEIIKKHDISGNNCGTHIVDLQNKINATYQEIKPVLIELYKEKKIYFRKGINGTMIFLKII